MGNNFCSSKHPRPLAAHRLTEWDRMRVLRQGPLTHSPDNTTDLRTTMPPTLALLAALRRSWTSPFPGEGVERHRAWCWSHGHCTRTRTAESRGPKPAVREAQMLL